MLTGNPKAAHPKPLCTPAEEMASHDHEDLALERRPTVIFAGYLLDRMDETSAPTRSGAGRVQPHAEDKRL